MTGEELERIKEYVRNKMAVSTDPQHGYDHPYRVSANALKIIKYLNISKIDPNLLEAICYLHDVPVSLYKHNSAFKHFFEKHAISIYLPMILDDIKVKNGERWIILNAIKRHPFSIPYKRLNRNGDIYTKVLQDADSIDFLQFVREEGLMENRYKYFFYFILSFFAKRYLNYARRNLGNYLNFPELARYNWFGRE
jgi:HD superfamily phosphodiesterase